MGIQKITFDGASITAKIDADLHHFLFSNKIGILKGLKNNISFTLANNTITFLDGYVAIFGRLLYIESNTQVSITPDSSKQGFVILGVNLTTNEVTLYTKEHTGSYPLLIQNNLSSGTGLYEFVLCAYSKTTTSVQLNLNYDRQFLSNYNELLEDYKWKLRSDLEPKTIQPTKISNGVYRINNTSSHELMRSMIFVLLNLGTVVSVPGPMIFDIIGSYTSVQYTHNNSTYSLSVSYQNNQLTFTCGLTTHTIHRVIFYTF